MANFSAGVTVVSTVLDGVPHAMTATAFCSVSLEPPLVLVSVGKAARFHAAVTTSGLWAASILAQNQVRIARHFSNSGRDLMTQFDEVDHQLAPKSAAPVITGALAWLDCATYALYDGGDHSIVVGEVLLTSEEWAKTGPLTYYRGSYRHDT